MALKWRELLTQRNPDVEPRVIGRLVLDDGVPSFEGSAVEMFRVYREMYGDVAAAELLLEKGWSNGMGTTYLGPLDPPVIDG